MVFLVVIIIVNFSMIGGFSLYRITVNGEPPANADSPKRPVHESNSSLELSNRTLPVGNTTTTQKKIIILKDG